LLKASKLLAQNHTYSDVLPLLIKVQIDRHTSHIVGGL
jgi:hypothetical protein